MTQRSPLIALLILILASSCAGPKHVPGPQQARHSVNGSMIRVSTTAEQTILGEMICVDTDSLYLLAVDLTPVSGMALARQDIREATLLIASTVDNHDKVNLATVLALLSTLGHGIYMVVTVPVSLIVTMVIQGHQHHAAYVIPYPEAVSWEELAPFCRFPQGLPEGIPFQSIQRPGTSVSGS
ncbi:MAG: hypothetical protein R2787_17160 [Saprospiraceae bacterium]